MGKVFKKAEDVVSDVFKPVNKVISRIVPNEIKPFIGPLASVLVPGGAGIMSNFARGYFANLLADSAVNEGKTDLRKAALSGIFKTLPTSADIKQGPPTADKTFLQKVGTEGKELTAKVGDFLNPSVSGEEGKILGSILDVGKAAGTQAAAGAGFDIYDAAKAAQDAYQNSEDGYNTSEYLGYLRSYLANAGYSQQQIDDYVANRPSYNKGGRVGLALGGDPTSQSIIDMLTQESIEEEIPPRLLMSMLDPKPTESGNPADTLIDLPGELEDEDDRSFAGGVKSLLDPNEMQVADNAGGGLGKMQQQLIQMGVNTSQMSPSEIMEIYNRMMGGESGQYFGAKKGGLATLKMGGMPSMEMDYRGGGFIPVGSKEKADDVPARLSKNEFVMTADAVRAAGGGSVNKGAQRMYQLMNQLESKV
jgi:hypothetical protein|tara:strand:+ start:4466 stop:5725 length:1260 start_codon:yes stop_codon:yes gene_type:complete